MAALGFLHFFFKILLISLRERASEQASKREQERGWGGAGRGRGRESRDPDAGLDHRNWRT